MVEDEGVSMRHKVALSIAGVLMLAACGSGATPPTSTTTVPTVTTSGASPTTATTTATTAPTPSTTVPLPTASQFLLGRTTAAGKDEIYLADWDGTVGENVTDDPANDHAGDLTSDHARMVFTSDRGGHLDVYVMDMATREVTRLTDNPADDWDVVWSPDGSHAAFFRASATITPTIFVVSDAGFDEVAVTDGSQSANHVDWSPDGQWLLVWMSNNGARDIFRMRPDGSDLTQITDTPGDEGPGSYSPDGSMIAFSYQPKGGQRDIWVMNADGSGRIQLTDDAEEDWMVQPFWSPDGSLLLYQHGPRGEYWVVPAAGGEPQFLFSGPSG